MDIRDELLRRRLDTDAVFSGSRSSGPGGQNVNKVNTRVELRYNIIGSEKLLPSEKDLILVKLRRHINNDGELIITAQSERSQHANKKKAIEKFYDLLAKALSIPARRIPTSPTTASKRERLDMKKRRSYVKRSRSRPEDE